MVCFVETSLMPPAISSRPPTGMTLAAWTLAPALVLAALALPLADDARNVALFIDWNGAAAALPPALWAGLTNLGATTGAFALLSGLLAWRPRWGAAALLAAPLATFLTHGMKEFYDHPRPPAVLSPEQITIVGDALRTSSFPSGHSLTAFVVAAVIFFGGTLEKRPRLAWLVLIPAAAVAFSRVAVGAHWPQDILAGAAAGWLCGAFGAWWASKWTFWNKDRGARILAGVLGLVSLSLFFENLGYPEGRWSQYALAAWGIAGAALALRNGAARSAA